MILVQICKHKFQSSIVDRIARRTVRALCITRIIYTYMHPKRKKRKESSAKSETDCVLVDRY